MKKIVPISRFEEMDRDVVIDVLYPVTQIDVFNYQPFNHDTDYILSKGVLVSTTYKDQIYYQYRVFNNPFNDYFVEKEIIKMKDDLKQSVMNHLDGYEEPFIPNMNCKCDTKKNSKGNCNSGSCNCK